MKILFFFSQILTIHWTVGEGGHWFLSLKNIKNILHWAFLVPYNIISWSCFISDLSLIWKTFLPVNDVCGFTLLGNIFLIPFLNHWKIWSLFLPWHDMTSNECFSSITDLLYMEDKLSSSILSLLLSVTFAALLCSSDIYNKPCLITYFG